MKNALLTLHRAWGLAHPGAEYAMLTGPIAAALERAEAVERSTPEGSDPSGEAGMATAEYAIGTLAVAGVIVNQYEAQTIGARSALEDLEKIEGLTILDPPIPKRAVIADALEAATGLDQWGGKDAAELADLYRQHLDTITKGAIK